MRGLKRYFSRALVKYSQITIDNNNNVRMMQQCYFYLGKPKSTASTALFPY